MDFHDKIKEGKTLFSFEVFPPKKTCGIETVFDTLSELQSLRPDFMSVTYNAGGSGNSDLTKNIALKVMQGGSAAVAHLTCINNSREEIAAILTDFKAVGIENILALRGDINPDIPPKHDFKYASDLAKFIKEFGGFHVMGACYPECHLEAKNEIEDILNLKKKVESGVDHLISQLFFDNTKFYDFRQKVAIAGINVPIEAGIMPVVNKNQIEKMVSMCGASLPAKFAKVMQRFENNPEALRDAGIAYAVDQIVDLISNGVDGIHLYTMNNPYVAKTISAAIKNLL
ncbi:MAG: methylenetetrahydrofolate reductase [NAD(P)H] [Clostridia bacterium]